MSYRTRPPSESQRHQPGQFARILPVLESGRTNRGLDCMKTWRMLPGLLQLAHLLLRQWSDGRLAQIGWRGPAKQWTDRADSFCIAGLPRVRTRTAGAMIGNRDIGHARIAPWDRPPTWPQPGPEGAGRRGLHRQPPPRASRPSSRRSDGRRSGKRGARGCRLEIVNRLLELSSGNWESTGAQSRDTWTPRVLQRGDPGQILRHHLIPSRHNRVTFMPAT